MSGMAEVLAAHADFDFDPDAYPAMTCICGTKFPWLNEAKSGQEAFVIHQAAALTAAGFGTVKEAAAVALEEAADRLQRQAETFAGFWIGKEMTGPAKATWSATSHDARWLRARAAAVRGEE